MAALVTQYLDKASGTVPSFSAAAGGGDTVASSEGVFLVVKNGGGAPITVTVTVPGSTSYGVANPDPTFTVANGAERWIPLFDPAYRNADDDTVAIAYSAVTSVTVGAFSV